MTDVTWLASKSKFEWYMTTKLSQSKTRMTSKLSFTPNFASISFSIMLTWNMPKMYYGWRPISFFYNVVGPPQPLIARYSIAWVHFHNGSHEKWENQLETSNGLYFWSFGLLLESPATHQPLRKHHNFSKVILMLPCIYDRPRFSLELPSACNWYPPTCIGGRMGLFKEKAGR